MARESATLIFDIQSGSVGVALVSYKAGKPDILWNHRATFFITEHPSLDAVTAGTLRSLQRVMVNVVKKSKNMSIDHVMCFYGSPWHISRAVTVSVDRTTPFTVTPKLLDGVVQKEKKDLTERASKMHTFNGGVTVVDASVIRVLLNGYEVGNPYQDNVKRMKCTVFLSVMPATFVHKVESLIHKHLRIRPIHHSASSLAFSSVVRDAMPHHHHFLAVVVGEEITEVSVIKGGEIEQTATFPSGKHALLRSIADHGPGVALSLTHLYLDNNGEPEWSSTLAKQLAKAHEKWFDHFTDTLGQLGVIPGALPAVMLVGDEDARRLFSDYIQKNEKGSFKPTFLSNEMLKDVVHVDVTTHRDTFLQTEALFTETLLKKEVARV